MHCLSKIGLIVAAASLLAACGGEPEKTEPSSTTGEASVPAARSGRPTAFGLCMTCHSDEPGRNGLGPSLFGVVGRRAGTGSGYSYSPALKAADFSWDEATIDDFIEKPRD